MRQVVFSTLPFIHLPPLEAVKLCLVNGAEKIEIFMEGPHWANMTEGKRQELAKELNQLKCAYSVHPPQFDLNLASSWPAIRESALKAYREAMYFAETIKATHIVIDPGRRQLSLVSKKEARETVKFELEKLLIETKKSDVSIGIENGPVARQLLFNEEEYEAFIASFNHPRLGAVLDTGHAKLAGWDCPRLIKKLQHKLLALHLNDTSGRVDNHLPLKKGTIEWESLFSALSTLKTVTDLVLELNTQVEMNDLLESKGIVHSLLGKS